MSDSTNILTIAADILFRESRHLDRKQWDEWLALFHEDVDYWIPSWDGEHELVQDPHTSVSLMYYANRHGLEDRVFRIRTGLSSASTPLPRTTHFVTNIEAEADGDTINVLSNWSCISYRHHKSHEFYGHYEHTLQANSDGEWLITRKKTTLTNELIPIPLDIYNV